MLLCSPCAAQDAANWLHPGADASVLRIAPTECLAWPNDAGDQQSIRLGRIAFRSPFLLGGLAGRGGLSCHACHRNGHGNPHFFIAGVSSAPGTADVTGAIFSKTRDDGLFNPVPIPTLVDAQPPFGTIVPVEDLKTFLRHAIEDEFQGQSPPDTVTAGLVAYLEALTASACPEGTKTVAQTVPRAIYWVNETISALNTALKNQPQVAEFLLISLQATLKTLHDRLAETAPARADLRALSRRLHDIRPLIATDPGHAHADFAEWRSAFSAVAAGLTES